jgi:hypothetical protein
VYRILPVGETGDRSATFILEYSASSHGNRGETGRSQTGEPGGVVSQRSAENPCEYEPASA